MPHNSVYEDHFVDQNIKHTIALVCDHVVTHAKLRELRSDLELTQRQSRIAKDDHIVQALFAIMDVSRDAHCLISNEHDFDERLWFLEFDDEDELNTKYFHLKLVHDEMFLAAYRFDRENRIQVGELWDQIRLQQEQYTRLDKQINPEIYDWEDGQDAPKLPADELESQIEITKAELNRLSAAATVLLAQMKF